MQLPILICPRHFIFAVIPVIILLQLISPHTALGQQTPQVDDRGKGYLEYLPPGYNDNNELYPTLIFLHGSGERGSGSASDLERVKRHGPPKLIEQGHNMCFDVNGTEECFLVFSPQTSRWTWLYDVLPLIDYLLDNYRIDPNRIYLTGLSMGGEGTWVNAYSLDNNPNIFAAIAPIAGRGGYQEACRVAEAGIPVWAFHGNNDTAIRINEGSRPINGMLQCDPNPEPIFTIYDGVGHAGTWNRAYRTDNSLHTPNLYQWFLSQSLEPPGNQQPVVNAGPDQELTLPTDNTTLSGSANDPDGTIASIQWQQTSGPNSATTTDLSNLEISLSDLIEGVYIFTLEVVDNEGLASTDNITITVNPEPPNNPPSVDAGTNITITLPTNSVVLDANASDADGTIQSILWAQGSGPGTATILDPTSESTNVQDLIEGTYSFTITATDDDGAQGVDNISVIVQPEPANNAPTVNAGNDQEITLPDNSTTVTGTASDSDGTIASYQWVQTNGPNSAVIDSPGLPSTTISNLIEGAYSFSLTATDDDGDTDSDIVLVNVLPIPPNDPPSADAGPDQTITLPTNFVTLNGTGTDSDGTVDSYFWSQLNGPGVSTIGSPNSASTNITQLVEGVYTFSLQVTDNDGAGSTDNVIITVLPEPPNSPPSVNAGSDINITLPQDFVNLSASATDTDGTITSIQWSQSSGPSTSTIQNPGSASTTVSGLIEGVYLFSVEATDDDGANDVDNVQVTVFREQNTPPVANAGADITIELPDNISLLEGSGTDSDGTIENYQWTQINGPSTAVLVNANQASSAVQSLIEGIYIFQLQVTDDDGAIDIDQVRLTVNPEPINTPPVANAGDDIFLTLPDDNAVLSGTGSDSDGTIASYLWEVISGPEAIVGNLNQQNLTVSGLEEGIYIFTLTVTDDDGAEDTDEVRIIVNSPNAFPVADAGNDVVITLPDNNITLSGQATDSDGSITFTLWEFISGPSNPSISDPFQLETTVNNLQEGVYLFSLLVQDNNDAVDTDEIRVFVNAEPANNPPTADAGNDASIILPDNDITLIGSGSDTDGTIVSFDWSQVSGPNNAATSNNTQASVEYSGLIEGNYLFRLTITDNEGAVGVDEVRVSVLPDPGNILPVVSAGNNDIITLPENSVTLSGTASDPDGVIENYEWSQVSGPIVATIVQTSEASTLVTDLVEGVFQFRLVAIDNEGGSSFDQVEVLVQPDPANIPPVVDAGDNFIIRRPESSVTFQATADDSDGTIADYEWIQLSGPSTATLTGVNTMMLSAEDLVVGTYVFRVTVTDNEGGVNFDEVNVRVLEPLANQPPLVNALENIQLILPTNITEVTATATDTDGSVVSVLWEQISGPSSADILDPSSADTEISNMALGTYVFRITATDDGGLTGFDQTAIRINPQNPNSPPEVNAGTDIEVTLPVSDVRLEATASDPDGTVDIIEWSLSDGPNSPSFDDPSSLITTVSNLVAGVYTFRVTVTDNNNTRDFDEVRLTVNPEPPNQVPSVNAGDDINTQEPVTSLALVGSASDVDGTIVSTTWSQQSGPVQVEFQDNTELATAVSGLTAGNYRFRLTAVDDDGGQNFDEMLVFVSANQSPVAIAGEDIEISYPQSSISLTGQGIDNDGIIEMVTWSQVSGPLETIISSPNTNTTEISDFIVGTYTFSFTVVDNGGAEAVDFIDVTVLPSTGDNQPPTANAGEDQNIILPSSEVTLIGEGTDPEGGDLQFRWRVISGEGLTLSDPMSRILTISDLIEGFYELQLIVIDNAGLSASDKINLVVRSVNLETSEIPRFLTPNGDGENDVWNIGLSQCQVTIYSSTGFKVFEDNDYQNDWDGTYNGSLLDQGAYYYTIICNGIKRSGGIRILR